VSALIDRLSEMTLLRPGWLWAAWLVPLAWIVSRRGPEPTLLLAPMALFRRAIPSWRTRTRAIPRALEALGLLGLVLGLAGPALPETLPARSVGLDILLALDVSSSMGARDLDPARTRLEVAKDAALAFAKGRPDDRVGVLTFARYPDLRLPPTRDHDALARVIRDIGTVDPNGPEDATGIGLAVAEGARALAAGRGASHVLILLTDGEENVALQGAPGEVPPSHAGQLAARLGVRVTTIVVGLGRRDASGTWRPLDTSAVEALARRTGGTFHEAKDAQALDAVYGQIDRLEKAPLEDPRTVVRDHYLPLLLGAIVLVLLGRVLELTAWRVLP
jgi:Ca-activated chloride channel family protein